MHACPLSLSLALALALAASVGHWAARQRRKGLVLNRQCMPRKHLWKMKEQQILENGEKIYFGTTCIVRSFKKDIWFRAFYFTNATHPDPNLQQVGYIRFGVLLNRVLPGCSFYCLAFIEITPSFGIVWMVFLVWYLPMFYLHLLVYTFFSKIWQPGTWICT